MLLAHAEPPERFGVRRTWSAFRRRHQAIARRGHAARRAQRHPVAAGDPPIQVVAAGALELTEAQWARVSPLLPPQRAPTGRPRNDHRTVLDGPLGVARTGSAWRDLPEQFGPWQTVYGRDLRWRKAGTWQRILAALDPGEDAEPPQLSL